MTMDARKHQAAKVVLVTGADGFLGSQLVVALSRAGHRVTGLIEPGRQPTDDLLAHCSVVHGDITEPGVMMNALKGVEVVHHLAAAVGDWVPDQVHQAVTVEGTRNILEAARAHGSRVVLASSVTVYGHWIRSRTCTEQQPHGKPMGGYSRAKQAQERLCQVYRSRHGVDVVVVRPGNIYGPGSGPWLHELAQALKKGVPACIGPAANNAGLVHVRNVAELFVMAQAQAVSGDVFNACDGLDVSWQRYFSDIARLVGARPPRRIAVRLAWLAAGLGETAWRLTRRKGRPPITFEAWNLVGHDNRFPADQARQSLGWQPTVDYRQGLDEIAAWIEAGGLEPG